MSLKKIFGCAVAGAAVAVPLPVVGPIAGFVGGAAVGLLISKGDKEEKKKPGL